MLAQLPVRRRYAKRHNPICQAAARWLMRYVGQRRKTKADNKTKLDLVFAPRRVRQSLRISQPQASNLTLSHLGCAMSATPIRGTTMTDREKILAALREKPMKVFDVMKRVNITNQDSCQDLLLKMREDGAVRFDIHKGVWIAV
jgi:hypothetical protein